MFSTNTLSSSIRQQTNYLGKTKINEMVVDINRMVKQRSCPGNGQKMLGTVNLNFEGGKGKEFGQLAL